MAFILIFGVILFFRADAGDGRTLKELLRGEHWENRVKVVRREGRRGWKAGNLNAALRREGEGVREFAVLDADTMGGGNGAGEMGKMWLVCKN